MGYYTNYELCSDILNDPKASKHIRELLHASTGCEWEAWGDCISPGHSMKWYEHTEDMIAISRLYPNAVFELSGWGEESADIWKKYFHYGKYQFEMAEIIIGEYNEDKLQEYKSARERMAETIIARDELNDDIEESGDIGNLF